MADHLTEEEQIEALKAWWAENGVKTLVSIVLIVGGYFSYQSLGSKQTASSRNSLGHLAKQYGYCC